MIILCFLSLFLNKFYSISPEDLLENDKFSKIKAITWLHDDSCIVQINSSLVQRWYPDGYSTRDDIETREKCIYEKATLSGNSKYLSIPCFPQSIFRYSFLASYLIYDLKTKQYFNLSLIMNFPPILQIFKWIGNDDGFSFVYENNIYYSRSLKEKPIQITSDGKQGEFYNGISDWIYEEEIFSKSELMEFDDSGSQILYASIDDTKVDKVPVKYYDAKDPYIEKNSQIAYSRPGRNIPKIEITFYNLPRRETEENSLFKNKLKLTPKKEKEYIATYFKFIDSNILLISWMHRTQDVFDITLHNLNDMTGRGGYDQKIFHGNVSSWIDQNINACAIYSDKYLKIYFLWPVPHKDKGDFIHVISVDLINILNREIITSGVWEVSKLICIKEKYLYYLSNENGVGTQHLYAVDVVKKERKCLTCRILSKSCTVVEVTFTESCQKAYIICKGPRDPFSVIRVFDKNDGFIFEDIIVSPEIETFDDVSDEPFKKTLYQIKGTNKIDILEMVPKTLKQGSKTDFLIQVYGGPSSVNIYLTSENDYPEYLAFKHGLVLLKLDVYGSYGKGSKNRDLVKYKLGHLESDDVATVINYYKATFPDSKFIILGWSYGGFLSLSSGANHPDLIKHMISVAPVVDWRYYDAFYTERYMGLPTTEDNLIGYEENSLLNKISMFKNSSILIIHGSSDDNVHPSNSEHLVYKMIDAVVDVDYFSVPFKKHNIFGAKFRASIYNKMSQFITKVINGKNNDVIP